ncbi:MAG: diacylglycerol kinase family protein [Armatimonadetes bacterium]|nr:diacylglycerol kinase family protein [Armatimonadota bacterium]
MNPYEGEPVSLDAPTDAGASGDTLPSSTGRDDKRWRPANVLLSFGHAASGIRETFHAERNFRFHVVLSAFVLLAGLLLHLSPLRMVALLFAIGFVWAAELFNTAIEAAVDLAMPTYHPLAKRAKDAAAGGVLVAALTAAIIGATIFLPALLPFFRQGAFLRNISLAGLTFALAALLWGMARRKRSASGTSKDSFRRTVIGVGLVAYASTLGYRMVEIVKDAVRPDDFYGHNTKISRPGLLFPGGVP